MGMNMMARLKAQHQAELLATKMVSRQEMADFFLIALNFEFRFGPKRLARVMRRVNALVDAEYDTADKDTKDKEYTRAKHEELMKQICGKYYEPREVRYKY